MKTRTRKKFDVSAMTYRDMADLVNAVRVEVKRRNPVFVNFYIASLLSAEAMLREISRGEKHNFTSESGPKE